METRGAMGTFLRWVFVVVIFLASAWLTSTFHDKENWILVTVGFVVAAVSSCLICFEAKSIDQIWLYHVYRILAIVLYIAFGLFAFLIPENGTVAVEQLLVFLAAAIALFLAARSGRVSERQLQQSRFEKAIEMISKPKDCKPENATLRKAGIILLDDLPPSFLRNKRGRIYCLLKALGVNLENDLPEGSVLKKMIDKAKNECEKRESGKGERRQRKGTAGRQARGGRRR